MKSDECSASTKAKRLTPLWFMICWANEMALSTAPSARNARKPDVELEQVMAAAAPLRPEQRAELLRRVASSKETGGIVVI